MPTHEWRQGDVARAYIMLPRHIQEITIMAHDPEFPGKLKGGIVSGSMIPKFTDGQGAPYSLGEFPWTDINEVDKQLGWFQAAGYTIEYAPGCGPEARALGCSTGCGHERLFGGCVPKGGK